MPDERLDVAPCRVVHILRGVGSVPLEACQPCVDPAPARAHEIHEERQIVDACMTLGEKLSFDPLEASDRLIEQSPDLGNVTGDRKHLCAKPVADCDADLCGNRRFESGCRFGEPLDLSARALECGLEHGRLRPAGGRVGDALLCTFQGECIHGRRGYSPRRMDTAVLDYELPGELIAQRPPAQRDDSRLLAFRRSSGSIEHRRFVELPDLLERELVVVNDTRVVAGRYEVRRATGGLVEVLLVEELEDGLWEGLARPTRRLRQGERIGPVELVESLGGGRWLVRLDGSVDGETPLPPYIRERLDDPERYQTIYAHEPGSAAAPTAGLHFTPELLSRLDHVAVTLHVGLDTFRQIAVDRLEEHALHGERYRVGSDAWERIAGAERVLAVGTTTVRTLETVARTGELVGRTELFVIPGFEFRRVDALLTNFHLPRSSLLALVMAFVGVEETREIYRAAIAERYRFYSFGDAMLVL